MRYGRDADHKFGGPRYACYTGSWQVPEGPGSTIPVDRIPIPTDPRMGIRGKAAESLQSETLRSHCVQYVRVIVRHLLRLTIPLSVMAQTLHRPEVLEYRKRIVGPSERGETS